MKAPHWLQNKKLFHSFDQEDDNLNVFFKKLIVY